MKILTISGSVRTDSANVRLLEGLPFLFPELEFIRYKKLDQLPLFTANAQQQPDPAEVLLWKNAIKDSDAMIICTPVYIYNLPALLKNCLEWVTASGELMHKKVLPITFTPNPPRGEKAMQSLVWSLQALDTQIVAQLPMYQNEIEFDDNNRLVDDEHLEILKEAIKLLTA